MHALDIIMHAFVVVTGSLCATAQSNSMSDASK